MSTTSTCRDCNQTIYWHRVAGINTPYDDQMYTMSHHMTCAKRTLRQELVRGIARLKEEPVASYIRSAEARKSSVAELQLVFNALLEQNRNKVPSTPDMPDNAPVPAPGPILKAYHHMTLMVFKLILAGVNVALVGPAGSGKTFTVSYIARMLKRHYESLTSGLAVTDADIIGFMSPVTGNFVEGVCTRAFRTPNAICLIDEADALGPAGSLALNALTANEVVGTPVGPVEKAENVIFLFAMNTLGQGGDESYLRQTLDQATLDRMAFVKWEYDEDFEEFLAFQTAQLDTNDWVRFDYENVPEPKVLDQRTVSRWVKRCHSIRNAARKAEHIGVVASPRAVINGTKLLRYLTQAECEEVTIWNKLTPEQIERIMNKM